MTEYVSCKTIDGTEVCLQQAESWDVRNQGVLGSPFTIIATFWAETWEDAMREHYRIHGFGEYTQ